MTLASPTLVDVSHLVGISDIAEHYGVNRAAVCGWRTRYQSFPAPVRVLRAGPVFLMPDVERWYANRRTP